MPTVTVAMPAYNAQKYLRSAVDSMLNQTFTDFELLIVNDGSADNTEAIAQSYSDPRIRYYANETNFPPLIKRAGGGGSIRKLGVT